jgi:hypothetical protein
VTDRRPRVLGSVSQGFVAWEGVQILLKPGHQMYGFAKLLLTLSEPHSFDTAEGHRMGQRSAGKWPSAVSIAGGERQRRSLASARLKAWRVGRLREGFASRRAHPGGVLCHPGQGTTDHSSDSRGVTAPRCDAPTAFQLGTARIAHATAVNHMMCLKAACGAACHTTAARAPAFRSRP